MTDRKSQQDWISTLRGFAALLVFLSHLESNGGGTFKFIIGRIGVVIFFLLSGYLAVNARNKRTGRQYIFNRLVRMYPVYWVILWLHVLPGIIFWGEPFTPARAWEVLANMTLFEEFMGYESINGASWMMPMQIVFFVAIGVLGVNFFTETRRILHTHIDMENATLLLLMIFAIITGVIRNTTGLPFPTAFFLLIAFAFLGVDLFFEIGGQPTAYRLQVVDI